LYANTLIRLQEGELVWYPPGTDGGPQALDSDAALQQLRAHIGQSKGAVFAVPGTDVTLLRVEFSSAEKKHISKALPFTLEEQLIADIDEQHIASTMLDGTSLCAAVCSQQKMLEWQQLLADCPPLTHWVAEPLLLPWHSGEWVLVIEQNYAIVRTAQCEGFCVELDLLPTMLAAALSDLPSAPTAVIVYGSEQAADSALLPEALQGIVQWRAGDLRAAMLLSEPDSAAVNLLQGEFAHRLPLKRWWTQWRAVAAVLLGVFCLQLVADYASYLGLERDNLALRRDIEQSYRRAFPKGALVDAEKQVKRQLDAMRGTTQGSGFVSLMNRVGTIIAARPGTNIESINYNDKGAQMRLNITATDFAAVEAIRNAMSNSGLKAVMENSNVQGDIVRARLRVGAGS
jgi:general secretion pathway protein L